MFHCGGYGSSAYRKTGESAAERQRRYIERLKSAADNAAPGALDAKTVAAWTNADRDEFLRELLRYLYFHTWLECKGIVTNEILNLSAPATRLDWEIEVDDEGEGYLSAYVEPNGLSIRQIGDELFYWHVNKDGEDAKDATDVAEGEASSLVAAMAAAEAAVMGDMTESKGLVTIP
jgi:hypothetical protein